MAYQGPRLRGGWTSPTPYPLGQIPDSVIRSIASNIVYSSAVGRPIRDTDWPDIFAAAVDGTHLNRPQGIVDVALGTTAWSAKTVGPGQVNAAGTHVRLISGRNDVQYSYGNQQPLSDVQETGNQVLRIWNGRVEEATQQYPQLRTIVLLRDMEQFQFKLFEHQTVQFDPADYTWRLNRSGRNLEARTIRGDVHSFTWQSGGTQFTIIQPIVGSARSFAVREPNRLNSQQFLENLGFDDSWVTFL